MNKKNIQKSNFILLKIAKTLIIFGIFCLIFFGLLFIQRNNPKRLAFAQTDFDQNISSINSSQTPKQLIIEDLKINLSVIPSKKISDKWEVTNKGVSYLTESALPGDRGNSVFYGHNWSNLLGNLTKAKPDQLIKIKYTDDSIKTFMIKYVVEINPDEVSILSQTEDKRITLYTCSGFFDTKRFVVVALLVK